MATITELLEALNNEEAAISTADLASKLSASKEGTLKQLNREKNKGTVEGNSQEGWLITDAGKKALEKGDIHPSMEDEEVTPKQQFEAIGRRVGEKEQRIVLATDIVWSEDYEDIKWVWEALGQADISLDKRRVWVNAWRAKLQKGIPPDLETELTRDDKTVATEGRKGVISSKEDREFIIVDDTPVRVGSNLGDYSLQDAKDILAVRALRGRFSGAGPAGTDQGVAAGAGPSEKVSDLITALGPFINKDSDQAMLRELISTQMALQRQEILSHIPPPWQGGAPKSFMEQATGFIASLSSLKEAGPIIRSMLGIPEPSGNPGSMDINNYITLQKFQGEERRADELHGAKIGLGQAVREVLPDGVAAIKAAAEDMLRSHGAKSPAAKQPQQTFECGNCHTKDLVVPPGEWEKIVCPTCHTVYTRDEVLGT